MKYIIFYLLFIFSLAGQSQTTNKSVIDSTLAKKITIEGFCLCQTNLNKLKELYPDLTKVIVEEMDISEECISKDSRFENGIGYFSENIPGIIFQKDKNSDLISKIRLTKSFKGKLPNGTIVDIENMKLKNLFLVYPELKEKWRSRGCSNYLRFSDDNISFYVKIDKNIEPLFPIDKNHYLEKPIEAIDLVISCNSIYNKTTNISLFKPNDPVFYLDSIRVNKGVLSVYDENEIAFITIYKEDNALKIAGNEGRNGVVFIYTKEYAKQKYWGFLKTKSIEYGKIVPDYNNDNTVTYVLNNKVLGKNYEVELYGLNDENFVDLKIIDSKELKKKFKVKEKKWGILIISKVEN